MRKHILVIFVVVIFIILAFSLASMPLKDYFLREGKAHLEKVENSHSDQVFEESTKNAVNYLNLAVLFNSCSIFNHSGLSEAYYKLGTAYLYSRQHRETEKCFKKAKKTFSKDDDYTDSEELELKILQSLVWVEGMVGKTSAFVCGNMVERGDLVKGIKVAQITGDYIVFRCNNKVFSDSLDKYNPAARLARKNSKDYFYTAKQKDNIGFARQYYNFAVISAKDALRNFRMDMEQVREMQSLVAECEKEITPINKIINEAKKENKIVIGMSKIDIEEVSGRPLDKNMMFDMNWDEQWVYGDKTLYFRSDKTHKGRGILVKIEQTKE